MGSKDMTESLHQLPLLTGMGQHHRVRCVYHCPALLCPVPALQQGFPMAAHCPQSLPASSAASVLIPCLGPAAEVWDAERDPSSQEPQPGPDGALPQITGLPHPLPCLIPCNAAALMLPAALNPAQPLFPTSCPHHASPLAPAWAGSVSHHAGPPLPQGSCVSSAAPSLTSAWAGLPAGLQAGRHTLSVSAVSQLPSLPAGRAGQSTASTLCCSWLLPPSLMLLQPGEARDSVLASGMGRSSPPALTARWC